MKLHYLITLWACCWAATAFTQPTTPYNPDSDGDGVIDASDFLALLSLFGEPFAAEVVDAGCPSGTLVLTDDDFIDLGAEGPGSGYYWSGEGCSAIVDVIEGLADNAIILPESGLEGCAVYIGSYEGQLRLSPTENLFPGGNNNTWLMFLNGEWIVFN